MTETRQRPEVAAGMAAARERGVRLGRPTTTTPSPAAHRATELRGTGLSLAAIAAALTAEGFPTPSARSAQWTKSSTQHILALWGRQASAETSVSTEVPPAS
jgi:hypothetical protein